MSFVSRRAAFGLVLCALLHGDYAGAEPGWNQFRGPNGSGVAASARPPLRPGLTNLAWKVPVAPGLSSPVIAGGKLFLTGVEEGRLITVAFDARTGRILWRRSAPEVPLSEVHRANSPAAPTPFVDDERVYVYFGAFGLISYDHAGRELWKRPIPTPKSLYGMSTSPIAQGDHLILVLDNDANLPESRLSQSRVMAFKKSTGEIAWETPRPLQRSGWSTPALFSHPEGEDLVVLGSGRVTGYDPATGTEKWFVTGFSRETIAVPVVGHGFVYASSAMLGGVADDQPDPTPFWTAMLQFDANGDGKIQQSEINEHFTFPLRPEVPPGHPGFGIPLATDPVKRREQQRGIFNSTDTDKDGVWTRDEFLANMSFRRGKPMLTAIRPGGTGDVTASHVAWQLNKGIPEIPSPIFHKDRLFLVRNGGLLTAVDARDGKTLYNERLESPGQFSASPVIAQDHVYLLSNEGLLTVVRAADTFEKVHQYHLGEPTYVTPALDTDTLYIRTGTNLLAFRSPPRDQVNTSAATQ